MALDKVAYIENKVKAMIGDVVIAATEQEAAAVPSAISFANVRYWKTFPYQFRECFNISVNDSSVKSSNISTLKTAAFNNDTIEDAAYYLGILRIDQNSRFDLPQYSGIDTMLLGKPVANGGTTSYPDLDKLLLNKTNNEILTGDLDFEHDSVTNTVKYVLPYIEGTVAVVHGFGFDDAELLYLKHNHLDLFARMTCFEYLDIIISARSAINLQGDFDLNIDFLKEKYNELKESLEKDLNDMAITPIIFS